MSTNTVRPGRLAAGAHTLTAFEHTPIPVGSAPDRVALTQAEAEQLMLIGEQRPGFCRRGYGSVQLSQYCGIVSLGERVLEILPKVDEMRSAQECRGILLRLLREAQDFPLFRDLPVGQALRRAPLLEVFIAAFFDTVTTIAQHGLLREYREREEDLFVVRGRVVTPQQFGRLFNRTDRLACRFDDLTVDNRWNRILKLGLRAVRSWIVSDVLRRRWVDLAALFDEVSDIRPDAHTFANLTFDRHAARYRAAVDWVRCILTLQSPGMRAGEAAAPGLLVDMNALFESAVAAHVRACFEKIPSLAVHTQDRSRFLARNQDSERPAFRLRPDLIVCQRGRVTLIVDTKWKHLAVDGHRCLDPDQTDIYQLYAYAAAYHCDHLALIYPWHSGLVESKETAFTLPPLGALTPTIQIVCIDLESDDFTLKRGAGSLDFRRDDKIPAP